MASDKVCMPIRFLEGRFEYCEIELENLTKESFLENGLSIFVALKMKNRDSIFKFFSILVLSENRQCFKNVGMRR